MKAATQYQNKTPEEIVRQYKKRLRAKQGFLILIFLLYVIVGIRGIWRGDYETFRRMEEARSAGFTAKLQKVVSAVCLADVDIACNELKNARTHLEYAIQEGGTLYVVEDARRMLAELAQKERMEGADHGDGTAEN